jgi:hypothetical protein
MIAETNLLEEELEKVTAMVEDYRRIYSRATSIGKQIDDLQSEMVKITMEMTNKSSEEARLYSTIGDRLGISQEDARGLVLEHLQKKMNS